MKVLVTGATGFVGAHTVAELRRSGHSVRLLARAQRRVPAALEPLGVEGTETIMGDVTEPASVERALNGCDSVVHCASIYSLDPRAAPRIKKTNVSGTRLVLEKAHQLGLDPIVHVSSFAALIGIQGSTLTPDSPPTRPPGAYFRSKADSDLVARRFQESGAPVVITYPGSVWGPHDPHVGESTQIARNILRGLWLVTPRGRVPISDVRDVARLHATVMKKGQGPRRYMCPSHDVSPQELVFNLARITERSLRTIAVPPWTLHWPMRLTDAIQRVLPLRLPFNFQAVYVAGLDHRLDSSLTQKQFGIKPRDLDETLIGTLRWMVEKGCLSPRLAGSLGHD